MTNTEFKVLQYYLVSYGKCLKTVDECQRLFFFISKSIIEAHEYLGLIFGSLFFISATCKIVDDGNPNLQKSLNSTHFATDTTLSLYKSAKAVKVP